MKIKFTIIGLFAALLFLTSCGNNNQQQNQSNDVQETAIDSLAVALHEVDSILNSGQLAHMDVYEIGKIKGVSVSVKKLSAGDHSTSWINFCKDCGDRYYYLWEDARLLYAECKYFIQAINTIHANKERVVDHEEMYAYVTKDDIRVSAYAKKGNAWAIELSVDYRKQNSTISLSEKDVEDLKVLIQKAQEKIIQIR